MQVLEIKKYKCIFCAMPAGPFCHIGIGVMLSQEDKPSSPKLAPPHPKSGEVASFFSNL